MKILSSKTYYTSNPSVIVKEEHIIIGGIDYIEYSAYKNSALKRCLGRKMYHNTIVNMSDNYFLMYDYDMATSRAKNIVLFDLNKFCYIQEGHVFNKLLGDSINRAPRENMIKTKTL